MEFIKVVLACSVLVFFGLLLMLVAHPAFGLAIAGYLGYLAAEGSKVMYGVIVFIAVFIAAFLMQAAAGYLNAVLSVDKESVVGLILVAPLLGVPVALYMLKVDKAEKQQSENGIEDKEAH